MADEMSETRGGRATGSGKVRRHHRNAGNRRRRRAHRADTARGFVSGSLVVQAGTVHACTTRRTAVACSVTGYSRISDVARGLRSRLICSEASAMMSTAAHATLAVQHHRHAIRRDAAKQHARRSKPLGRDHRDEQSDENDATDSDHGRHDTCDTRGPRRVPEHRLPGLRKLKARRAPPAAVPRACRRRAARAGHTSRNCRRRLCASTDPCRCCRAAWRDWQPLLLPRRSFHH